MMTAECILLKHPVLRIFVVSFFLHINVILKELKQFVKILFITAHIGFWILSIFSSVSENRTCGVVFAEDADLGRNGKVSYELVARDKIAEFLINSETGVINSLTPLNLLTYHFQVSL